MLSRIVSGPGPSVRTRPTVSRRKWAAPREGRTIEPLAIPIAGSRRRRPASDDTTAAAGAAWVEVSLQMVKYQLTPRSRSGRPGQQLPAHPIRTPTDRRKVPSVDWRLDHAADGAGRPSTQRRQCSPASARPPASRACPGICPGTAQAPDAANQLSSEWTEPFISPVGHASPAGPRTMRSGWSSGSPFGVLLLLGSFTNLLSQAKGHFPLTPSEHRQIRLGLRKHLPETVVTILNPVLPDRVGVAQTTLAKPG